MMTSHEAQGTSHEVVKIATFVKSLDELDFDDSNGQVRYQHLNIGYISTYQSSHQKILMPDSCN
jgi:hypothetical protein